MTSIIGTWPRERRVQRHGSTISGGDDGIGIMLPASSTQGLQWHGNFGNVSARNQMQRVALTAAPYTSSAHGVG